MQRTCSNPTCAQTFEWSAEDEALLAKCSPVINKRSFALPPPTLCSTCRLQRRLTFRNQKTLYRRPSSASGKNIISIYSADKPFVVFSPEEWWADSWDAIDAGKDLNPNASFVAQFSDLMHVVPHIGVLVVNSENSDFTNQTYDCRNCYLCSAIKDCEDCFYCHNSNKLSTSADCSFCFKSELLYQCRDTYDSYHCAFASNSIQCSDCTFVHDCIGCISCFQCSGLRNKQYHIRNRPCTKEEYAAAMGRLRLDTFSGVRTAAEEFTSFLREQANVFAWLQNCENSVGNNLKNCKNSHQCFDSSDLEDCRHSAWIFQSKDCMDCYGMGESQLCYECVGVEEVQQVAFSFGTSSSSECYYTDLCFHCRHCIGCVGLRHKEYCILNKQYSKEDYEKLAPQIFEQMQRSGEFGEFFPTWVSAFAGKETEAIEQMRMKSEWGEFFPPWVSAFAYNESKANEHFPLTKEVAEANHFRWKDDMDQIPSVVKIIRADQLPDQLKDIPDDVLNWAIQCEKTGRPYQMQKKELQFYRNQNFALPHFHPDERQRQRMEQRNPLKTWSRQCAECQKAIETTYSPERPERVLCEECYLKKMY